MLLEIVDDIKNKIADSINIHVIPFQRINSKLTELVINITEYEILPRIEASASILRLDELSRDAMLIIKDLLEINSVLNNSYCEIISESGYLSYDTSSRPYIPICIDKETQAVFKISLLRKKNPLDAKKFYLITEQGAYFSIENNSIVPKMNQSESSVWELNFIAQNPGQYPQYHLNSGIQAIEKLRGLSNTLNICDGHQDKDKRRFVIIDTIFSEFLENSIRKINAMVADPSYTEILPSSLLLPWRKKRESPMQLSQEQRVNVIKFVNDIFPRLIAAEGQNLILCIGNMGSGKSTFINDCGLKLGFIYDEEKGMQIENLNVSYAKMGSHKDSVTLYPECFRSGEYSYCDTPGFNTRNPDQDMLNAFSMFMVKEMAAKITAVVVMIAQDEMKAQRGLVFHDLLGNLRAIIDCNAMDVLPQNLILIVNHKGWVPPKWMPAKELGFKKIATILAEFQADKDLIVFEELQKKQIEREPEQSSTEESTEPSVDSIQKFRVDDGRRNDQFFRERIQEKINIKIMLEYINLSDHANKFEWHEISDEKMHEALTLRLDQIKHAEINKDYLLFQPLDEKNKTFLEIFEQWVEIYYIKPIYTLIKRKTSLHHDI